MFGDREPAPLRCPVGQDFRQRHFATGIANVEMAVGQGHGRSNAPVGTGIAPNAHSGICIDANGHTAHEEIETAIHRGGAVLERIEFECRVLCAPRG